MQLFAIGSSDPLAWFLLLAFIGVGIKSAFSFFSNAAGGGDGNKGGKILFDLIFGRRK